VLGADSNYLAAYRRAGLTAVKPNYDEALALIGRRVRGASGARADEIAAWGDRILKVTGARRAAVTLDTEGAIVLERDRPPYRTYARPARHSLASGAGDTFLAALLAVSIESGLVGSGDPALAGGSRSDRLAAKLRFAAAAGSLAVEGVGLTGVPSHAAVVARAARESVRHAVLPSLAVLVGGTDRDDVTWRD
jgi:sugar/nucleoside kinase (ribokinase family)